MKKKEKWKKFCNWIFSGFVEVFRSGVFTWLVIVLQFVFVAVYIYLMQYKDTQNNPFLLIMTYFILVRSSCRFTSAHIACRSFSHREPNDESRQIYRKRAAVNFIVAIILTSLIPVLLYVTYLS